MKNILKHIVLFAILAMMPAVLGAEPAPGYKEIKGRVEDEHGQAMTNFTMTAAGKTVTPSFNYDGTFTAEIPESCKAVSITCPNYFNVMVPITGTEAMRIPMKLDMDALALAKVNEMKKLEAEAKAAEEAAKLTPEQKRAIREQEAAEKQAEKERIAAEKQAEKDRIAAEKQAEADRIAAEKKAQEERIAAEKERILAEKQAESARIAAEKQAEADRIAAEKQLAAEKAAAEKAAEAERKKESIAAAAAASVAAAAAAKAAAVEKAAEADRVAALKKAQKEEMEALKKSVSEQKKADAELAAAKKKAEAELAAEQKKADAELAAAKKKAEAEYAANQKKEAAMAAAAASAAASAAAAAQKQEAQAAKQAAAEEASARKAAEAKAKAQEKALKDEAAKDARAQRTAEGESGIWNTFSLSYVYSFNKGEARYRYSGYHSYQCLNPIELDYTFSWRFNRIVSLGAGVGCLYDLTSLGITGDTLVKEWGNFQQKRIDVPVFVNVKTRFCRGSWKPFIDISGGWYCISNVYKVDAGIGVEYDFTKKTTIFLEAFCKTVPWPNSSAVYQAVWAPGVKLGVTF